VPTQDLPLTSAPGGTMKTNKQDFFENCAYDAEQPFPKAEYDARLRRIRERMAKAGIDLLFVGSPDGINYVTGHQVEWYQAQSPKQWPGTSGVAIHVNHDKYILFETVRELLVTRYVTHSVDTRTFPPETMRDGTGYIVKELKAEGWLPGKIGLEYWSYRPIRAVSERFETRFKDAGCTVVDGSDVLREVRHVKSPLELACIEKAGKIAEIGMAAARDAIAPGVTELEVYGVMVAAMAKAGGENPGITMPVISGQKTGSPHALASRKKIRQGELVSVDVSGVYNRYHCNMARTFSVGEPSKAVKDVVKKAMGSYELVRKHLKPNARLGDVSKILVDYYKAQGIFEDRGWIGGYEMGIAFPPDWVGNFIFDPTDSFNHDRVFEPNTVINYENQFYLPDRVGHYFQIDSIMFTATEAKFLTNLPGEIVVV
jgi:Xaa-Pro dipeptidase